MDVPDPAAARELAAVLQEAADDLGLIGDELAAIGMRSRADWHGNSSDAAGEVIDYLAAQTRNVSTSFQNLGQQWDEVAVQFDSARTTLSRIHKAEWIGGALTVVSIAQLGLDPITDVAAGASIGGAAGAAIAAERIVEEAFAAFTARFLAERSALMAVRAFAGWAAPRLTMSMVGNLALQELTTGHVDPRSAMNQGLAGALIPGTKLGELRVKLDVDGPVVEDLGLSAANSWGRAETLQKHFDEHGADFGAGNPEEYASQAADFLRRSKLEDLPTIISENGVIRTYHEKTNEFGSYNPDLTTRTYFAPEDRVEYWIRIQKRYPNYRSQ